MQRRGKRRRRPPSSSRTQQRPQQRQCLQTPQPVAQPRRRPMRPMILWRRQRRAMLQRRPPLRSALAPQTAARPAVGLTLENKVLLPFLQAALCRHMACAVGAISDRGSNCGLPAVYVPCPLLPGQQQWGIILRPVETE